MKKITIRTNKEKFFLQYVSLCIKPIYNMTTKETAILAWLLYFYADEKARGESDRAAMKFVFDYDTKVKIRDEMGDMSVASFNNTLMKLREKNLITYDAINANLLIDIEDETIIEFKFIIE